MNWVIWVIGDNIIKLPSSVQGHICWMFWRLVWPNVRIKEKWNLIVILFSQLKQLLASTPF